MAKKQSPANRIVKGIRSGSLEAFNEALSLARGITKSEIRKKHISSDILDDIVQQALVNVLASIEEKECTKDNEIIEILTRTILDQTQAEYDREHIEKSGTNLNYDEVTWEYLHDAALYGKVSMERTPGDLFDQSPLMADFVYKIYKDEKKPKAKAQSRDDVIIVDDQLIDYFRKHPQDLYTLNPRRFEELVASILEGLGYSVELTAQSADGGVDIFATQKSTIGEVLIIVDCKRYSPDNHVGVGIVRALYGIGEQVRATMAMLATTSFFTKAAKEFQRPVRHRLTLKDYNDLLSWLRNYGVGTKRSEGLPVI